MARQSVLGRPRQEGGGRGKHEKRKRASAILLGSPRGCSRITAGKPAARTDVREAEREKHHTVVLDDRCGNCPVWCDDAGMHHNDKKQ